MKTLILLSLFIIFDLTTKPPSGFWIKHRQTKELKWISLHDERKCMRVTIHILEALARKAQPNLYEMMINLYPVGLKSDWELV